MTPTNRIEEYISQLELDNMQLSTALEDEKQRVKYLLKWLYLSNQSRILLEIIDPETLEFCFENNYSIDEAYKIQVELNEVRSWLGDFGIKQELKTKEDVINAREQINREVIIRNDKS